MALDVDFWSSTTAALELLKGTPEQYLPRVVVYVDDIALDEHNSKAGARLAIREFNDGLSGVSSRNTPSLNSVESSDGRAGSSR